ncbi:MAG: mannosyltransferase [Flavobacteriaceae bacterium]|nr:mannosyltransferase [Bacteroidia bacterium]NNF74432.1 mannosyltransferase [Flavobacteriaceae bacterium]NNK73649.1 mannosyltransferase [Flavobacteriaceae bacterium]
MNELRKTYQTGLFLVVLLLLTYSLFGYELERSNFTKLMILITSMFVLTGALLYKYKFDFKFLVIISVLFRLVFLFAIPNLSQDFYRFIWDGRMILEGFNPYIFTPQSFLTAESIPVEQGRELIDGMGELSAGNFTNYPPLNQLCFALAGLFAGKSILGSVIVLRILIIGADLGTLYFGKKLLSKLGLAEYHIFWYLLNPFIIIELTANLHFEGVMIFFLVWSLYLLHNGKWVWSAILLALSVSIKLMPLMFLPLMLQKLRFKSLGYYLIVGLITAATFMPFYNSEFATNFSETIGLWFQKFEFNGSLYYIAREIGYTFRGYNEIAIIGSYIPYIVILSILILALVRKNGKTQDLITAMMLAFTLYLFTSTTVHPWYITTLIGLSIFTRYRYPLIWSFLIFITYHAYGSDRFHENLWLISLEYIVLILFLTYELFNLKGLKARI